MGCKTKVQVIQRKNNEQWYLNLPLSIAQALEFQRGEVVEWIVENSKVLGILRADAPKPVLKKTLRSSLSNSSGSGVKAGQKASRTGSGTVRKG